MHALQGVQNSGRQLVLPAPAGLRIDRQQEAQQHVDPLMSLWRQLRPLTSSASKIQASGAPVFLSYTRSWPFAAGGNWTEANHAFAVPCQQEDIPAAGSLSELAPGH